MNVLIWINNVKCKDPGKRIQHFIQISVGWNVGFVWNSNEFKIACNISSNNRALKKSKKKKKKKKDKVLMSNFISHGLFGVGCSSYDLTWQQQKARLPLLQNHVLM